MLYCTLDIEKAFDWSAWGGDWMDSVDEWMLTMVVHRQ